MEIIKAGFEKWLCIFLNLTTLENRYKRHKFIYNKTLINNSTILVTRFGTKQILRKNHFAEISFYSHLVLLKHKTKISCIYVFITVSLKDKSSLDCNILLQVYKN